MKADDEHIEQIMVGVKIWQKEKLDIIANETGKPRSQIVREALDILFRAYDKARGKDGDS